MSYWDHFQYSVKNCFGGHAVHRLHWRRRDEAWLEESLHAEGSGFVPVWQSRNLVSGENLNEAVVLSRSDLGAHLDRAESVVLLGEEKGRACFAVHLPSEDLSIPRQWTHLGVFEDLRRVGAIMDASGAALLAYARAITYWHQRNRFCGDCGSPAASAEGGHMRVCTDETCGQQRFPRTDPAVIVLVESRERALLGRQPPWPTQMYSVIAGFVEPGESLEAAVVREVYEEAGIEVGRVTYHSSQPWPFPCSLMLGFTAEATTETIHFAGDELEDAKWFSREELRRAVERAEVKLPSKVSISYRLIEHWFDSGNCGQLARISGA